MPPSQLAHSLALRQCTLPIGDVTEEGVAGPPVGVAEFVHLERRCAYAREDGARPGDRGEEKVQVLDHADDVEHTAYVKLRLVEKRRHTRARSKAGLAVDAAQSHRVLEEQAAVGSHERLVAARIDDGPLIDMRDVGAAIDSDLESSSSHLDPSGIPS